MRCAPQGGGAGTSAWPVPPGTGSWSASPSPPPPAWAGVSPTRALSLRSAPRPRSCWVPGRAYPEPRSRTPRPSQPFRGLLAPSRWDQGPGGAGAGWGEDGKKANKNHGGSPRRPVRGPLPWKREETHVLDAGVGNVPGLDLLSLRRCQSGELGGPMQPRIQQDAKGLLKPGTGTQPQPPPAGPAPCPHSPRPQVPAPRAAGVTCSACLGARGLAPHGSRVPGGLGWEGTRPARGAGEPGAPGWGPCVGQGLAQMRGPGLSPQHRP